MLSSASRIVSRRVGRTSGALAHGRRGFVSCASHRTAPRSTAAAMAVVAAIGAVSLTAVTSKTCLERRKVSVGGELIQTGTPVTEQATGILFPQLCNGMSSSSSCVCSSIRPF